MKHFYVADRSGRIFGQCLNEMEAVELAEQLTHRGEFVGVFPHPVGAE